MSESHSSGGDSTPSDLQRTEDASAWPVGRPGGEASAVVSAMRYFSGPIPPPQVLASCDQALPGLADRIVTMAEKETQRRQEMERQKLRQNSRLERRGQIFGFTIAVCSFLTAGILIAMGKPLYGMSTMVAAVAGLSGLFMWSRTTSRQKRATTLERN